MDGVTEIDLAGLRDRGLIRGKGTRVKILGEGELTRAITVRAHAFSKSAAEKIAAAGGQTEVVE